MLQEQKARKRMIRDADHAEKTEPKTEYKSAEADAAAERGIVKKTEKRGRGPFLPAITA